MQRALSYKRITRLIKVGSIGGATIILLLFYSWGAKLKEKNIDSTAMSPKTTVNQLTPFKSPHNYEIIVTKSVFEGYNKNQSPYKITAETAIKLADDKYELGKIHGKYPLDREMLLINADNGVMDDIAKSLILKDKVQILLEDFIFTTEQIQIDLTNKELVTEAQVKLFYKNSLIKADKFRTSGQNNLIIFNGNVTTQIKISDF